MKIRSFFQTLAVAALPFLTLYAQTGTKQASPLLVEAAPETVGFNPERLSRLDGVIQSYIHQGAFPGVAAIVVKNGKIVYHKAFGKADLESGKPLTKDAVYRIASMTKAITSLAVMMLHEEGKIMLDDPISKYIPEFAKPVVLDQFNPKDSTYTTVPAKREISVRHLLSHMSGINYNSISNDERIRAVYTKAGIVDAFTTEKIIIGENIKKLAKMPLTHQPGEKWTYGLSTDVLGYLVEVVSGMPLDRYFQTRIFEPLGMKDTYFYLPEAKKDRLVPIYSETKEKTLVKGTVNNLSTDPDYPAKGAKSYFSGGGGLSSTAYDYAIFLQMLLNGGVYNGKRLLSPKGVELFTNTNQSGPLFPEPRNYFSLGFRVIGEEGRANDLYSNVGVFGWGGAFSTHYFADPKEKISGVLMKQMWPTSYGGELDRKFDLMIYQALEQ
ncbi:MAG: serine hydrolase domain-containing protein [Spirosomataceae bacterium]